jgi:hypothetical protein
MKLLTLACVLGSAAAFVPSAFKAPSARSVQARTTMMAEKSKAIPFLPRPVNLDGTIPGDVGACAALRCVRCVFVLVGWGGGGLGTCVCGWVGGWVGSG